MAAKWRLMLKRKPSLWCGTNTPYSFANCALYAEAKCILDHITTEPSSLRRRAYTYTGNHYMKDPTTVPNVSSEYTPLYIRLDAFELRPELPGTPSMINSYFPLRLEPDLCCTGKRGSLQAYSAALSSVTLGGPTNLLHSLMLREDKTARVLVTEQA